MPILSRRNVAALAASFCLLAGLSFAVPGVMAGDNTNLVRELRAGGFVIVVRHGATFPDQADTDPFNFDNIAAQRNLNDKGKALAKAFGDALFRAGVPVGKVFTSKYSRAYETAVIAGFKDIEKTTDLTEGGLVVSPNENSRVAPTRFSLRISQTLSTRSARSGSMSKRARPRCSAPRTVPTSSSPECRWRNGLTSQRRRSEGRWACKHANRVTALWARRWRTAFDVCFPTCRRPRERATSSR